MSNARVTVRIHDATYTFEMERNGRTIFDVARAQGATLPAHCLTGWCKECRCRVNRGTVQMARNSARGAIEMSAGYVYSCCSRPLTDEVEVEFDGGDDE